MLETIRQSWGWRGFDAAAVVETNKFGNVIVQASDGKFWRVCPENPSCEVIAPSADVYEALWRNEEFQVDWQMRRLVQIAEAKFGPVTNDRCYCLKLPSVLGGAYEENNLGVISHVELLAFSGDVAKQIKDVPDGAQIKITLLR
jgi:hypothetical protein